MESAEKKQRIVGRAEEVSFPEFALEKIPARIDTGARTSALWASNIHQTDGTLYFTFFDKQSSFYTGKEVSFTEFDEQVVASSNGITEQRYKVKLLVTLKGKKVRASFTLTDRSSQVYPILVGRNVLFGKFIVDVKKGKTLYDAERQRIAELQSKRKEK
jgi:hypothetical protein